MDLFEEWIDELYAPAQAFTAEHLAETIADEQISQVVEITINIPKDKMQLLQHIDLYKDIWSYFKKQYKGYDDKYVIEYCKSGQPHLHGYMTIDLNSNVINYPTEELLKMLAKTIYLILPRKYYKQLNNAHINEYFKLFKAPAVTLNLKNLLYKNWCDYIEKNAPKQ